MKKIMSCFLELSTAFFLISCGTNTRNSSQSNDDCEHDYILESKIDPTEESDGKLEYICPICLKTKEETIPRLDTKNYTLEMVEATCKRAGGKLYSSSIYGEYLVETSPKLLHSTHNGRCEYCHQLVGNFVFKEAGKQICLGYPRLYQLSDYWNNEILLGGDNGKIHILHSQDDGQQFFDDSVASFREGFSCANVDLFELANHDIICCYRAIGIGEQSKIRKLCSSISHDGGYTWEDMGDIVDNYALGESMGYQQAMVDNCMTMEPRIGFFEPYVDYIRGVPTVFYADDFTPMLEEKRINPYMTYRTQYLIAQTYDIVNNEWNEQRQIIMDGTVKKSPTGSNLSPRVSRDGMPVFAKMHDGTYVVVFEGTYRDRDYPNETGQSLSQYHPFEILLSYSKDGKNWSNPVEIYTPMNEGSKASAPYVVVSDDDRLIVSFQTDEDAVAASFVGDAFSVMKCFISKPGIPIEDINKDSFYGLCNVQNTPIGSASLWNGMMIKDNKLYCCSSGATIKVSDIPDYAEISDYLGDRSLDYSPRVGSFQKEGDVLVCKGENKTLLINDKYTNEDYQRFSTYVTPSVNCDCGIIFGAGDNISSYWEESGNGGYYMYLLNKEGYLILAKVDNDGHWSEIVSPGNAYFHDAYNCKNTFKMEVYHSLSGNIICYLNGKEIFKVTDTTLTGHKFGFRSDGTNTKFTPLDFA